MRKPPEPVKNNFNLNTLVPNEVHSIEKLRHVVLLHIKNLLRRFLSGNWHCLICRGEWTDRGTGMEMAFWKHKDWCPLKKDR